MTPHSRVWQKLFKVSRQTLRITIKNNNEECKLTTSNGSILVFFKLSWLSFNIHTSSLSHHWSQSNIKFVIKNLLFTLCFKFVEILRTSFSLSSFMYLQLFILIQFLFSNSYRRQEYSRCQKSCLIFVFLQNIQSSNIRN